MKRSRAIAISLSAASLVAVALLLSGSTAKWPLTDEQVRSLEAAVIDVAGEAAVGALSVAGEVTYESEFWDDMQFPVLALSKGGVNDPDLVKFSDDGAGSTGVYVYCFDKNTDEELFLIAQTPHSRKDGTDIEPHVHWAPSTSGAGNVVWGLECTALSDINDTFGTTTILSLTDAADGVAKKHQFVGWEPDISGSGTTISAMTICRFFRDANNAADTYDADACALEVDFHFQFDTPGSVTAMDKDGV